MYISPGKFCVGGGADTVIPLTFCTCDVSRGQGGLDCHLTLRPMLERHEADRCCPFLLQKKMVSLVAHTSLCPFLPVFIHGSEKVSGNLSKRLVFILMTGATTHQGLI